MRSVVLCGKFVIKWGECRLCLGGGVWKCENGDMVSDET